VIVTKNRESKDTGITLSTEGLLASEGFGRLCAPSACVDCYPQERNIPHAKTNLQRRKNATLALKWNRSTGTPVAISFDIPASACRPTQ